MERLIIFDTTLRDGEQSPGASMNTDEKIRIAQQLERLGVDVIEAGFAVASPGDFDAVKQIASVCQSATICSLARANEKDVKAAGEATLSAAHRRIHTFIATSPLHMAHKLRMSPEEVLKRAVDAVAYARTFTEDVEFSCEDATRSERTFVQEVIHAVVEAGAKTVNLPDTLGYALPHEYADFIGFATKFLAGRAVVSVHCHNDLGLAVANVLAAIGAGARQIECTINGIGERAGNSALEEIVMGLKTRSDSLGSYEMNIRTREIYPTSRLVAAITGIVPQPNKAIVGKNAFLHASGIHQDGVLKHRATYEIMNPADIGIEHGSLVLSKHSGRAALSDKAAQLGYQLSEEDLGRAFVRFKELADKKKELFDEDIRMILGDAAAHVPEIYRLCGLQIGDAMEGLAHAAATLMTPEGERSDAALGAGVIDAVFKVVDRVTGIPGQLMDYRVEAVSQGQDAQAQVTVKVIFEENAPAVLGHGLDIDTMEASARAYVAALNSYLSMRGRLRKEGSCGDFCSI